MKSDIYVKYVGDEEGLLKYAVNLFSIRNKLPINGGYLEKYKASPGDVHLLSDINKSDEGCSVEDIIRLFGDAITDEEKKTQGVVYTPENIRKYIVREVLNSAPRGLSDCLCADVACGCGAFLYTIADELHSKNGMSYGQVLKNVYGVDINPKQIERSRILLSLAALKNGENLDDEDINLFRGDSLRLDLWKLPSYRNRKGFDIVVGNPPYSTSSNLCKEAKRSISQWKTGRDGKADLYIPFFEAGINALAKDGILSYITVNNFFKSVNARTLRKYFAEGNCELSIEDFGNENVFPGVLSYNCITTIRKRPSHILRYTKVTLSQINEGASLEYTEIPNKFLDATQGWVLGNNNVISNIAKIENTGVKLGNAYKIRSGIATLANDKYIFTPPYEDEKYFYLCPKGTKNVAYKIEKTICRDIVKPRNVDILGEKLQKIIYPYDKYGCVIGEEVFKQLYPEAYRYLSSCRHLLDKRNVKKGNSDFWYEYGRSQNLRPKGHALLLPMMCRKLVTNITEESDLLVYNGNGIYGEKEDLEILKKILESDVFAYYIRNISKPYAGGYYSLAKSYIKNFGICHLTEDEKVKLLAMNKENTNNFLILKYDIKV